MASLADSLRAIDRRYRDEYGMDLGLTPLLPGERTDVARWLDETRPRLESLGSALKSARRELNRLAVVAEHVWEILPLTAEGWPARKVEINTQFARDTSQGLHAWLGDWYRAAAEGRLDALERLQGAADSFPLSVQLVLERTRTAEAGLHERNWHLAAPMLNAGRQLIIDGRSVVAPTVSREIDLLLARLAIEAGLCDEAAAALMRARNELEQSDEQGQRINVVLEVLNARLLRASDPQAADLALQRAHSFEPENLDLAVELVTEARAEGKIDRGLETARAAIEARVSLSDITADLGRTARAIPPEIWTAIADRAARENDSDVVLLASQRAMDMIAPDDYASRAQITELRAAALDECGADDTERAAAWFDAAEARSNDRNFELGRTNYEKVLTLDPGNVEAKFGLADCLRLTNVDTSSPSSSTSEPLALARHLVRDGMQAEPMTVERSWGYLVEASLCDAQAGRLSQDRPNLLVESLGLACSATAYRPEVGMRWARLSDSATEVGLTRAAALFAEHALSLSSDPTSLAASIVSFANADRLEEALELTSGSDEPWIPSLRATLALYAGRASESLKIFESTTQGPASSSARIPYVHALALAGRWDEARSAALAVLADLGPERGRPTPDSADEPGLDLDELERDLDDYYGFKEAIYATLFVGFTIHAQSMIERLEQSGAAALKDGTIAELRAMSALIRGKPEECAIELRRIAENTWAPTDCSSGWSKMLRPLLEGMARRDGLQTPDFDAVDELMERRRTMLASLSARNELAARSLPMSGARQTTLVALLLWAEGSLNAAKEVLSRDSDSGTEGELTALAAHIDQAIYDTTAQRLAQQVVELTKTDVAGARVALERLFAHAGDDSWAFFSGLTEADVKSVASLALSSLALPGFEQAVNLLWGIAPETALAHNVSDPTSLRPLRLELPPSWFAGVEDPVREHPLFLRYLPEARTRASFPSVRVEVATDLEPGDYRLTFADEVISHGTVEPTRRYCRSASLALLPDDISAQVSTAPDSSQLVSMPEGALARAKGLAELLTMPAVEVVIRAVADAGQDIAGDTLGNGAARDSSPSTA